MIDIPKRLKCFSDIDVSANILCEYKKYYTIIVLILNYKYF